MSEENELSPEIKEALEQQKEAMANQMNKTKELINAHLSSLNREQKRSMRRKIHKIVKNSLKVQKKEISDSER